MAACGITGTVTRWWQPTSTATARALRRCHTQAGHRCGVGGCVALAPHHKPNRKRVAHHQPSVAAKSSAAAMATRGAHTRGCSVGGCHTRAVLGCGDCTCVAAMPPHCSHHGGTTSAPPPFLPSGGGPLHRTGHKARGVAHPLPAPHLPPPVPVPLTTPAHSSEAGGGGQRLGARGAGGEGGGSLPAATPLGTKHLHSLAGWRLPHTLPRHHHAPARGCTRPRCAGGGAG